ncbi:hypothetical protein [Rhizobium lentis]|nr:hypothetical protein [Rhizobium lentis]MBX4958178.1 hypothetical protein [Rhizobium lentis]MBX4998938.1 hypothetical protein [Rhizobium lentis]MBX5006632.1 hypothetical protein [Rhizobium lentis]MBX5013068.1 hypothetical protein [Rhizobium lentis]MBX5017848.1 hypothetical protein [Rhizobium lentis]
MDAAAYFIDRDQYQKPGVSDDPLVTKAQRLRDHLGGESRRSAGCALVGIAHSMLKVK